MILFIAFVILYFLPASDGQIVSKIPNIATQEQLEQFKAISDFTQWSILGRAARASFILAMCIELLIECSTFLLKGLPILWRWAFNRNARTLKTVEQLKLIKEKIEMNARLTRREQRLYDKWITTKTDNKKGGNDEDN
ncbi:hypothetical protein [Mycoplasma sp. Z1473D]